MPGQSRIVVYKTGRLGTTSLTTFLGSNKKSRVKCANLNMCVARLTSFLYLQIGSKGHTSTREFTGQKSTTLPQFST